MSGYDLRGASKREFNKIKYRTLIIELIFVRSIPKTGILF